MIKFSLFLLSIISFSFTSTYAGYVLTLVQDDFDVYTAGKTVFLQFYTPWCNHCKKIAGEWRKLADEYRNDENILVAAVDCEHEDSAVLCDDFGIEGYPTFKYGDPTDLREYEGDRSYRALSKFAKENLKPSCSINAIHLCSKEKKELIEKFMSMSMEDLMKIIDRVDEELEGLEDEVEDKIDGIGEKYEEIMGKYVEETTALKKETKYDVLKTLRAAKAFEEIKEMEKEIDSEDHSEDHSEDGSEDYDSEDDDSEDYDSEDYDSEDEEEE